MKKENESLKKENNQLKDQIKKYEVNYGELEDQMKAIKKENEKQKQQSKKFNYVTDQDYIKTEMGNKDATIADLQRQILQQEEELKKYKSKDASPRKLPPGARQSTPSKNRQQDIPAAESASPQKD